MLTRRLCRIYKELSISPVLEDNKQLAPPTPEERALERMLLEDPPHLREYRVAHIEQIARQQGLLAELRVIKAYRARHRASG